MKLEISPGPIKGKVNAMPSKSHLHRLLICAALAQETTIITSPSTETQAEDITATIACLGALGADISKIGAGFAVTPINREKLPAAATLPCGESGSTLRFMLPVTAALGVSGRFEMAGRLPQRPLTALTNNLPLTVCVFGGKKMAL